jgi:hypothetical protein
MVQSAQKISVTQGERAFITFLVNFVVTTSPGDLLTNLEKISKYMLESMDALAPENLYRKQYGNLKECVTKGKAIMAVFQLDGTCFKFQKPQQVEAAHNDGLMEEAAWAKYQQGR